MNGVRKIALGFLLVVAAFSLAGSWITPHDYAEQFRDHPNAPPSREFPLGTDELGRDRLSRLLAACRISLVCAPSAALVSMLIAATLGTASGILGGWVDALATALMDLFLSLPWLFAVLTLRAFVPLNAPEWIAIASTFALLAAIGWASSARVIRASVLELESGPALLFARACGCRPTRLFFIHLLPNLLPVLSPQFWTLLPVLLLTEANLGLLGLGMPEPVPSLGNMLAELQNYERAIEAPWILAPAVLLALIVAAIHLSLSRRNTWQDV